MEEIKKLANLDELCYSIIVDILAGFIADSILKTTCYELLDTISHLKHGEHFDDSFSSLVERRINRKKNLAKIIEDRDRKGGVVDVKMEEDFEDFDDDMQSSNEYKIMNPIILQICFVLKLCSIIKLLQSHSIREESNEEFRIEVLHLLKKNIYSENEDQIGTVLGFAQLLKTTNVDAHEDTNKSESNNLLLYSNLLEDLMESATSIHLKAEEASKQRKIMEEERRKREEQEEGREKKLRQEELQRVLIKIEERKKKREAEEEMRNFIKE